MVILKSDCLSLFEASTPQTSLVFEQHSDNQMDGSADVTDVTDSSDHAEGVTQSRSMDRVCVAGSVCWT